MDYSELLHKVDIWLENVSKYQLENLKNKAFNVEFKDSRINYLTNIDIESEKRLISFIKQSYPSHSILGEETGFNDNKSEYEWVIDPIDGTTNYIHGYPAFTISIALKHTGELILKEAGGKISHTIIADHKLLISGNPKIHDLLYKKILEIS